MVCIFKLRWEYDQKFNKKIYSVICFVVVSLPSGLNGGRHIPLSVKELKSHRRYRNEREIDDGDDD